MLSSSNATSSVQTQLWTARLLSTQYDLWEYAAFSCLCRGIYMTSHNLFQDVLLCYSWYQPALLKLVQRRLNMCVVSPGRPCRPLPWHFDEIWRETECCRGNIYVLTHLNTPSSSLSPLLSYSQSVFTICCPPPCYRLLRRRRDL